VRDERALWPRPCASTAADWAAYYVENGLALVPIIPGEKRPAGGEGWQDRALTIPGKAWYAWDATFRDHGMGAHLAASNLCTLDVDDKAGTREALARFGVDLDALLAGPYVKLVGGSGRPKLVFRDPGLTYRKLAKPGTKGEAIFELRAGVKQDVLPPSIHPSGNPYRWERAPWEVPLTEPPAELLEVWRDWPETEMRGETAKADPEKSERAKVVNITRAPSWGGSFDAFAFLERHGVTLGEEDSTPYARRRTLELCPFGPHENEVKHKAAVLVFPSGAPEFKCARTGCRDVKGWIELRELLEPGYRDRWGGGVEVTAEELSELGVLPSSSRDWPKAHRSEGVVGEEVLGEVAGNNALEFSRNQRRRPRTSRASTRAGRYRSQRCTPRGGG
jgi:hypothetical protein